MNFYNLLLTFLLILLAKGQAFSQFTEGTEHLRPHGLFSEVEFFAGPGLGFLRGNSSVESSESKKARPYLGYSIGIGLNSELSKSFDLGLKLFYERKGAVINIEALYFNPNSQAFEIEQFTELYVFSYYTATVGISYRINPHLSATLGPFVSYLNKHTVKQEFGDGTSSLNDYTRYYKKFDSGILFQFAFQYNISDRNSIKIQLVNTFGLVDTGLNFYNGQTMKTNNTSLLFSLVRIRNFNLKKL